MSSGQKLLSKHWETKMRNEQNLMWGVERQPRSTASEIHSYRSPAAYLIAAVLPLAALLAKHEALAKPAITLTEVTTAGLTPATHKADWGPSVTVDMEAKVEPMAAKPSGNRPRTKPPSPGLG